MEMTTFYVMISFLNLIGLVELYRSLFLAKLTGNLLPSTISYLFTSSHTSRSLDRDQRELKTPVVVGVALFRW